jgi:putative Mn2+ efflux pump MntP
MSSFNLLLLSAALGTDLFSVAIPIGMTRVSKWTILWSSFVFACFHIVMILAGYNIGHWLGTVVDEVGTQQVLGPQSVIENWAGLLGAVILILLGLNMIRNSLTVHRAANYSRSLQGWSLMMLATSVSIDAFAAGISMGMMDVDLLRLSFILGVVIFIISLVGLSLGRQVGRFLGCYSEIGGGLLLTLFGINVFISLLI